ncbi:MULTISPECIES: MarR family winged helix-turn-helix transcriptional regulator [Pelosinus]|uniref:Regulatory protein MarR n=2 Tax=Pelosinus TaxID=365348 RepID=I9AS32_9FIRM|nr:MULTISPECIES: MarR family transcriptional regulator [Pelosinus]EIW15752.1 regulatory protein MarR [Pelosinus fermentans B4]EIW27542.1 transcriptional regulator, MarR family [Pelosinus fermentans A11]
MKKDDMKEFLNTLKRLTIKMGELSRHASNIAPVGKLSFSELGLMTLIGDFDNIRVTELALKYGATKGAISKMVKKLVQKELVTKSRTRENEKEVLLSLTAMGMTIYNEKEAHLDKLSADVSKELESLTEEQRISLFNILHLVETHIDEHLNEPNSEQD